MLGINADSYNAGLRLSFHDLLKVGGSTVSSMPLPQTILTFLWRRFVRRPYILPNTRDDAINALFGLTRKAT
jgi:hypothetical protein